MLGLNEFVKCLTWEIFHPLWEKKNNPLRNPESGNKTPTRTFEHLFPPGKILGKIDKGAIVKSLIWRSCYFDNTRSLSKSIFAKIFFGLMLASWFLMETRATSPSSHRLHPLSLMRASVSSLSAPPKYSCSSEYGMVW